MDIPALPCLRFEQQISKPLLINVPVNPQTLGEHIRKRRIELRLLQKDLAAIFNVSEDSITYWENNRSEPQIQYYPPIFGFLGYCPFELDTSTPAGKIKTYRYLNGLSQKHFAMIIGVDPDTVGRWEAGKGPFSKKKLELLLNLTTAASASSYSTRNGVLSSLIKRCGS
ncbi:helix-turn-helix domain-containing protein [Sphingobacterium bovistauri]|uniref:Helix-turn-helix domain-containing protein n=1 Tax=Sphingobacterium bovistauri TaxID=2781959 RepID=A0ABS7Z761_9SPHI|nr:helix-turn-helix domain-containing protein [Sphingobacterium bovistauri]MCA5005990.1 helix-turn-helix domain-containing protein [Sphingobacterium bovistauri]